MMKRLSNRVPGYDCIRTPCGKNGCGTHRGSSHGIHNEVWRYVVIDGDIALALLVGSGVYPETVPEEHRHDPDKPSGDYLFLHVGFPTKREQLLPGAGPPEDCEYVGKCYSGEAGNANVVVKMHFVGKTFEQPESFWLALEERLARYAHDARRDRADTRYMRCGHCDGLGTVPR